MPSWVKDEAAWEKAKARVRKEYPEASGEQFYRLVTAIYQRMTGGEKMAKAMPVLFFKAVKRGDTQTIDLLGASPALMPETHVETRTRKDGVTQTYHVSNPEPAKVVNVTAQKEPATPLTSSANGSSIEPKRGGTPQAPQAGVSPMSEKLTENQEWVLRRFAEKRAKGREVDLNKEWGDVPGYVARWAGFGEFLSNPTRYYWNDLNKIRGRDGIGGGDKNYVTFPREGPQFAVDPYVRRKADKEAIVAAMKADLDKAKQEIKEFMASGKLDAWLIRYEQEGQ